MSYRITESHLQGKVDTVNRLLGNDPDAPYSTVGLVILSGAYGGTGVHRYSNTSGGVSDLMGALGSKREVALFLNGMIEALRITQEVTR
jgi:hypothetical protein